MQKKNKRRGASEPAAAVTQLRSSGYGDMMTPVTGEGQLRLYRQLRAAIPILDAAVCKLVRLVGGFTLTADNPAAQDGLDRFLRQVPCGHGQIGAESFLSAYLDSLFTCGRAVGEMVVRDGRLAALNWGDPADVVIRQGSSPLETVLCAGDMTPLPCQELLLLSVLNPEPDNPYGVSLLRSMPAFARILMQIYQTIGTNWERAGNVRYSVVYRPGSDALDRTGARERSEQMAQQWSAAMQSNAAGEVRDFVAVGDVEIRVIGADGQILDAEVPVRQILEQLVAKTGLPPFLLGLSWSSTERMAVQQADLLTSELWAVRRAVTPALERIGRLWLRLEGYGGEARVQWDEINLLDTLDEAHAAYYRAQTEETEQRRET